MVGRIWKPPFPLNGHIFSYGRTDSGKTWKLIAVVQYYYEQGYKIWDLWGGKRKEGGFWCFPSDENKLWFEYQKEVGYMKEPGPKQYEIKLLFPFFINEIPNKLPKKLPRIQSKLFTLYFKDIDIQEISTITGALPNSAQRAWNTIKKELSDEACGEDILAWFEKKENRKIKSTNFYEDFIKPFCKSKILTGKSFKYNLDLIKEAKEKHIITILMDEYTPEKYKMFFILHIMRKVYEMGEKDIIHRKNLGLFRELNYFMKVQDESAQDAEQKQIMRNEFSNIARYGRSAFLIAGDTQSPNEVKGLVEGQDDMLCLNQLPGMKDREIACERLVRDGRMSGHQRDFLGSVEMTKEKMVVVCRNQIAKLIKRVQPPRTKCFKIIDGNFLKVWKKIYNEWDDNVKEYKKYLEDLYYKRKVELEKEKEEVEEVKFQDELVRVKATDDKHKRYIENQQKEIEEEELII
ncbi:MAG: hypothetical protein ACOCV1_00025 [Bacillota bacterium]